MRILVHDYAGHPFQLQLSRQLAEMGHPTLHCYSGNFPTTPQSTDSRVLSANLQVRSIDIGRAINRQNYRQLFLADDPAHGKGVVAEMDRFRPDVVISANSSPQVNRWIQEECWRSGIPFVCWVQDLYGHSAATILPKKLGATIGGLAARYMNWSEQKMFRHSDALVVISEDFKPFIRKPGGPVVTIENWAPMDEIPIRPRINEWGEKHGLDQTRNLIYSGTIGMKHNPELLVQLAERFRAESDVRVVVISAGAGMDYLQGRKQELGLENLVLMGFQPFADLPDVMATADVLLAILEPEAGVFSVPSKVLSYLCAGRALLLAVPPENLAAKIVKKADAGIVVSPSDMAAFIEGAVSLMGDAERRDSMGSNGRTYAEQAFDITRIAERFVRVFERD